MYAYYLALCLTLYWMPFIYGMYAMYWAMFVAR